MARASQPIVDPARDAASLLRRIGFLTLMLGLPLAAFASRTGAVLVLAIAVALLAAGAVFDRAPRQAVETSRRVVASPARNVG